MLLSFITRILWIASVMLAVTVIVFAIVHLSGDPTNGFVDPGATPEVRALIRENLGLDDPLPVQYLRFLGNALTGDFGESWRANRPALTLVLERMGTTLRLAVSAISLAMVAGVAIGSLAAWTRSLVIGGLFRVLISTGQALPSFWVGATLVLIFAVKLGWLPSSGASSPGSLILPTVTLALQPTAMLARLVETQLQDALRSDFVRTARGKGLSERTIFLRHALRSGIGPILGYLGVQMGFLVGSAVIVEGVFAYPGVGLLALNAVRDRDLPVIQSFVVVLALLISLSTLAVDLLARLFDPRIARQGAGS